MKRDYAKTAKVYDGRALIADPIYQYIWFTVSSSAFPTEKTEKDLIDSPWVQRLRRIHQLQSARWVYPAAEHTRFQHSLGTMHMAGEVGKYLYSSLKETCFDVPSANYIEETLRIAGLLHDIGHGPFGHFFDDNFLDQFDLTHEILGQQIIIKKLSSIITKIKRSPSGIFVKGERLDPLMIAFLIRKPKEQDTAYPRWLHLLRQLFSGIYTVDNFDYVQRDAYMSGFSLDIVDIQRLQFYTFFTSQGLTLHQAGTSALSRFLHARLSLYSNIYYHRTTRALDLHLQEIFRNTMNVLLPRNPAQILDDYLQCDEWSLYQHVKKWSNEADNLKRKLAKEWEKIHSRQIKWKMAFATELSVDQVQKGFRFSEERDYEKLIRAFLPERLKRIRFRVDLAMLDPRPINPMIEGEKRINVYDPATERISMEPLKDIYRFIPARVVHFRVFALTHNYDEALSIAAESMLASMGEAVKTNI